MSARTVTLRGLVTEDIARIADGAGLRSVARLLRRSDIDDNDLAAVCADLRGSEHRAARNAGVALAKLRTTASVTAAIDVLAGFCGLEPEDWVATTRDEQGTSVEAV